jgi:hypothetical protein
MMREIVLINHNDDGTATVFYANRRVETYTTKDEIAAICSKFAEEKESRKAQTLRFPDLSA